MSTLNELSFTSRNDAGLNYWDVQKIDQLGSDNETGRRLAAECIDYMRDTGATMILGHIARAMADAKRHGPVEIGFWYVIARAAIS